METEIKITLAAARVNAGLTQAQAAERLGISKATLVRWEGGKTDPSIKQASDMADLYGVNIWNFSFAQESTN